MLNTTRCVGLMGLLCGLALCVVHLRTEQARVAAQILSSQAQRVELRRELWTLQMAVARLRTPDQIRARVERLVLADPAGQGGSSFAHAGLFGLERLLASRGGQSIAQFSRDLVDPRGMKSSARLADSSYRSR